MNLKNIFRLAGLMFKKVFEVSSVKKNIVSIVLNAYEMLSFKHKIKQYLLFFRDFQGTTIGMAHISVMCGTKSASVNQVVICFISYS